VEEGSSITANVRLSNPLLIDVIFPLIFTPQTAEISDYLMLSSITIPQHELHGSGMIGTMVDEDLEDELFTISLGTLPPNMLAGDTTSIDVTILDQGMVTSTQPQVEPTITTFALEQNYPNPFNPSTSIEFSLDETQHVTLTVYDMLGQKVETIVDGVQSKGRHHVVFSATGLSSSKYFYVLQTDQNVAVNVMTLLK